MKNLFIVLILVLGVYASLDISAYRKHIESTTFKPKVLSQIPELHTSELPKYHWWGNVNGTN